MVACKNKFKIGKYCTIPFDFLRVGSHICDKFQNFKTFLRRMLMYYLPRGR